MTGAQATQFYDCEGRASVRGVLFLRPAAMSKNRMVNTRFWDDGYTANLDPIEKLLFLYFLTNTSTNICGIYEIPLKKIALETGIEKEMVTKIIGRFAREGKVVYIDGWIVIKNFLKHQNQESPKVKKGIVSELEKLPQNIRAALDFDSIEYDENPYLTKRQAMLVRDNFTCRYCNTQITDTSFELDHIIPASRGGRDLYTNMALACRECNQKKGNQTAIEFCGRDIQGTHYHAEKAMATLKESESLLHKMTAIYPDFSLDTTTYKYSISTLSHLTQPNLTKLNSMAEPEAKKSTTPNANEVIDLFDAINPSIAQCFKRKHEREAAQRLFTLHGLERLTAIVGFIQAHMAEQYFPTISTPADLESKWVKLEAFAARKKAALSKSPVAFS
jgi:hypothetical protein